MMNLTNHVENHGKKNKIIFVLRDLRRAIKEDIVFVMKEKTHLLKVLRKKKHFN